ncbi:MAG TPA: glycosyltransferase [Pyrinomonadaceae bacterium]|jgi:glycosyltransferase involved in cell wall biosynthesis|nr:glycosyltransferase [Pyrinomonadaceae bacterium]
MNSQGQTICLNMIVKDEASVIRRCLDSVRPIVDYWVIVDTGSTDGTQEIIREHLKDVPGELHERPWRDFAHNRSEALALARGRGDYVLVIDADEILQIAPGFELPALTCDSYNIHVLYGGCSYMRRQLVSNSLPWRYEGVLHEYITCEQARTEELLRGLQTVPFHDGARARDANTYRRDALVLERALIDDPQNTRYVFYLAQSYRDAGDFELSLRNYKRRAEMGGWPDEVWYSLYQVAQLRERTGAPWPEVLEGYLTAWQYLPDRAGPLYRVGMHYQGKGEHHTSHLFFSRAMRIACPAPNRLFVEQAIYDYQLPIEYAVACYYVGDHAGAVETNNRLLRSGLLPPQAIEQVVRNRRFSLRALFPKATAGGRPSLRVVVPLRDPGPELDDCIDSLHRQDCDDFRAVFLDYGSESDHSARVPRGDARLSFRRVDAGGWRAAIERHVREEAAPEEVVLVLMPESRLADAGAMKHVIAEFEDAGCELAYGQFRLAAGGLGMAEPAPSEWAFLEGAARLASRSAVAFRARLLQHSQESSEPNLDGLFRAAGFARTRFSDAVWNAESAEPVPEPARVPSQAPAVVKGKLPGVSCLMVTLDRLTLAKRSIRSFAAQRYEDRELLIVTDGSEVFRRALERYVAALGLERVRFFYPDGDRLTLGHLRNISMEEARGELICQWDDDDYSHPDRLAVQVGHMLGERARACFLTDHLQFIEEQRMLCWIDWTVDGTLEGTARLAPGTLLMFRDARFKYPEEGPYARQGEDSVFLERLYHSAPVAQLSGAGHLYLYQYHGRNTFPREHHYHMSSCRTSNAHLHENADRLREAASHYPIPRPYVVAGREGTAFAVA